MHISKLALALGAGLLLWSCGTKRTTESIPTTPTATQPIELPTTPPKRWEAPLGDSIRHEMRAVWLTTAYGLDWPRFKADSPDAIRRQKEELELILDRLVEDGYNTIFFQARLSGSTAYYSDREPFSRVFNSEGTRPNYDPLAFAVEACHSRGLSIHAWLVTYPLTSNRKRPHPIISKNRHWAIAHMGSYHLDPGLPEVRTYIAELAADIAKRYAIDGIHFDYFRYPEEADRFNDKVSYQRYSNGRTLASWRRDNLSKQLEEINSLVHQIRPEVQISVAPLGKLRKIEDLGKAHGWTAYDDVYQDVESWARRELVDFVVPMMYYKDILFEPFLSDWQETVGKYVPVIAGLAPYRVDPSERSPWEPEVIADQIDLVRQYKGAGISMFREGSVGPRMPKVRTFIQRAFKQVALRPQLSRGEALRPVAPHNLELSLEDKHLVLKWQAPEQAKNVTYRVWGTMTHADGKQESILIVQGLKEQTCTLRLQDFTDQDFLELGVEAVNSFGWATPCSESVVYNLSAGCVVPK